MKYSDLTTKKAKIQFIKDQLITDTKWAVRGLLKVYDYQTASEQQIGDTRDHNSVGFTGADGNILSSFAEQVKNGRTLSEKQVTTLHKCMPKYATQLQRIVEGKQ